MEDKQSSVVVDGGNGRSYLRITLPTAGSIASIVSVLIFISGFTVGYLTFKAEMTLISQSVEDLKKQASSIGFRLNTLQETVAADRQAHTNALNVIQTDIKYITQGIAELKQKAGVGR